MYSFTRLDYQQILTLDRISLQHRAPRDCGREEGGDNSTILLKDSCKYTVGWVFKLGRLICELKLLQVHSFGQGVLQCPVRKCRWNWFHIKSLLLGGNSRLPYRSSTFNKFLTKYIRKVILLKENNPALSCLQLLETHSSQVTQFTALDTVLGRAANPVLKMLHLNFTQLARQSPSVKRRLKIAKYADVVRQQTQISEQFSHIKYLLSILGHSAP